MNLPDLGISKGVTLKMDSASAIKLSRNPEFHSKTKHILLREHFIREKVEDGTIVPEWVPTKIMVTDGLTKALPRLAFEEFVRMMGLTRSECHSKYLRSSEDKDSSSVANDKNEARE